MDKYEFMIEMLNSRNLSIKDRKRVVNLTVREIEQDRMTRLKELLEVELDKMQPKSANALIKAKGVKPKKAKDVKPKKHAPKDTASFLALFNDPKGFKFLTHDFDPDSDMNYEKLMANVQATFKHAAREYTIPKSLYALMNTVIKGGRKGEKDNTWTDAEGIKHSENFACNSWKEWAEKNPGLHLLMNKESADIIMKFRSTIRLVKPALSDIFNELQEKYNNTLTLQTKDLDKADFYTYVLRLRLGIDRILRDMSVRSSKFPNVKISFERKYPDDFSLRIIKITQEGSEASDLDDVINKFNQEGGAFKGIAECFAGYCNWSVEALWDGEPKRWNILNDEKDIQEVEIIDKDSITGFTHILTYFSK